MQCLLWSPHSPLPSSLPLGSVPGPLPLVLAGVPLPEAPPARALQPPGRRQEDVPHQQDARGHLGRLLRLLAAPQHVQRHRRHHGHIQGRQKGRQGVSEFFARGIFRSESLRL